MFICSREEDLLFSWIRIECRLSDNPADNDTIVLAQVALDGLLQSGMVQTFIVDQSTVVSGTDRYMFIILSRFYTVRFSMHILCTIII